MTPEPPFTPFRGARIAVVGLGRAGLPAALRLAEWGAEVEAWDDGEAARRAAEEAGLTVRDGDNVITCEAWFDYRPVLFTGLIAEGMVYRSAVFRPRFGKLDVLYP